jgi:hypothetical protein
MLSILAKAGEVGAIWPRWRPRLDRVFLATWITLFGAIAITAAAADDGVQTEPPAVTSDDLVGRAVLVEPDGPNSHDQSFSGTVIWRTEPIEPGGRPDEIAIHADIDVPHKFKVTVSLRRNSDKNLAASHFVELAFRPAPEFEGSGIYGVPGILMKRSEQARGTPLASTTAKRSDGTFVVRMSNYEADRNRNLILLRSMPWLDIPILYGDQRRVFLTIEKGVSGSAAFLAVLGVPSH